MNKQEEVTDLDFAVEAFRMGLDSIDAPYVIQDMMPGTGLAFSHAKRLRPRPESWNYSLSFADLAYAGEVWSDEAKVFTFEDGTKVVLLVVPPKR